MDFVMGLPRSKRESTTIWVIVDRLTNYAHSTLISITYGLNKLAQLYVREIVLLHGVLVSITSDRDSKFTSRFWMSMQRELGIQLNFIITFYPQTDNQLGRTIHILEDMLSAVILDKGKY